MNTLPSLIDGLRHDQNGIQLEDIDPCLKGAVDRMKELGLVHVQDEKVLKPCDLFFAGIDQLKPKQRFPLAIYVAFDQRTRVDQLRLESKIRIVSDPYVGNLVVLN